MFIPVGRQVGRIPIVSNLDEPTVRLILQMADIIKYSFDLGFINLVIISDMSDE